MSGDTEVVMAVVADIVAAVEKSRASGHGGPGAEQQFDELLWESLGDAEMMGVGLDPDLGGSGGSNTEAAAVVGALARAGARVPAAEHLLVALPTLEHVGLLPAHIRGPLGVAQGGRVTGAQRGDEWQLDGEVDVAWGSATDLVLVMFTAVNGPAVAVVPSSQLALRTVTNVAGEPRSRARLVAAMVPGDRVRPSSSDLQARVAAYFAVARSVQIGAAIDEVLSWTASYVSEREQFGRPLSKLATVQSALAGIAGEVAVVSALVDRALAAQTGPPGELQLAAAAAKVRASVAAGRVARVAHQLHGAIGYTREHRLHTLTTRLLAWRSEDGSARYWSAILGAELAAAPELWPGLVGSG